MNTCNDCLWFSALPEFEEYAGRCKCNTWVKKDIDVKNKKIQVTQNVFRHDSAACKNFIPRKR